jgi:murein endopeptidase
VARPIIFVPALLAALAAAGAAASAVGGFAPMTKDRASADRRPAERRPQYRPRTRAEQRIRWRRSLALGAPTAGRLVRGVQLPLRGRHFATWDPVLRRRPNRGWRRWATDRLVRLLLDLAREYRAAQPQARPLLIGDLSRPDGGDFGPQFGHIGHASHQNGLDADIYYPRSDGAPKAPRSAAQIDTRLAQDIVDRLVNAGAVRVFVGPGTHLHGQPGVVQRIPKHDNHLHVRIAP